EYQERPDGKFDVTLTVKARKMRADETGEQQEQPLADEIDVGVLDEKGDPILLERRRFDQAQAELHLVADRRPVKAGIDPLPKLIDRTPDDNTVPVKKR